MDEEQKIGCEFQKFIENERDSCRDDVLSLPMLPSDFPDHNERCTNWTRENCYNCDYQHDCYREDYKESEFDE